MSFGKSARHSLAAKENHLAGKAEPFRNVLWQSHESQTEVRAPSCALRALADKMARKDACAPACAPKLSFLGKYCRTRPAYRVKWREAIVAGEAKIATRNFIDILQRMGLEPEKHLQQGSDRRRSHWQLQ